MERDKLLRLAAELRKKEAINPLGTALIGFDGYIDRVVRVKKNQNIPPALFEHIGDFARHIMERQGRSLDIALSRLSEKIGGNGTLMAESLALKNISTVCAGAMGYPKLNPAYEKLASLCRLLSVEEPAITLGLEFNDAKIMLAEVDSLDRINWEKLCLVIGKDTITQLIAGADLLGFTNWSGLAQSNDILSGIAALAERRDKKGLLFFDLADPSCKSHEQFAGFFSLINKLSISYNICIGLNCSEMIIMYNHFFSREKTAFDRGMAGELAAALPLEEVVVHSTDWAISAGRNNPFAEVKGIKIDNPVILTGAGDNFNAGYCLGKLCSFDSELCLYLGNISATMFVEQGHPAEISGMVSYIEKREKTMNIRT